MKYTSWNNFNLLDYYHENKNQNTQYLLRNVNFSQANLYFANFQHCHFIDCIFTDAILEGAELIFSCFEKCHFNRANLSFCNLSNSTFTHCSLENTNLTCSIISSTLFLKQTNLTQSNFSSCVITGKTMFEHCNLTLVNFQNCQFSHTVVFQDNMNITYFEDYPNFQNSFGLDEKYLNEHDDLLDNFIKNAIVNLYYDQNHLFINKQKQNLQKREQWKNNQHSQMVILPSFKKQKLINKMNDFFVKGKNEQILEYSASNLIMHLYMAYLRKKYNISCANSENLIINVGNNFSTEQKTKTKEYNNFILAAKIAKCIGNNQFLTNIFLIPVSIVHDNSEGHMNMLIYRSSTRTFEHFEPHGDTFAGQESEIEEINSAFIDFTDAVNEYIEIITITPPYDKIRFESSSDIMCPYGLQGIEEKAANKKDLEGEGYCMAWSMFFGEMCLRNPMLTGKEIYEYIYDELLQQQNSSNYLQSLIRGYVNYIFGKLEEEYKVMFGKNFTKENLAKSINEFSEKESKKVFQIINLQKDIQQMNAQSKNDLLNQNLLEEELKERYGEDWLHESNNAFKKPKRTTTSSSNKKRKLTTSSLTRKKRKTVLGSSTSTTSKSSRSKTKTKSKSSKSNKPKLLGSSTSSSG
jgi:uncharacterized protein YjbI with pentapeptide repeats